MGKTSGDNQQVFYSLQEFLDHQRKTLETRISEAINNKALYRYFEHIHNIYDAETGFELTDRINQFLDEYSRLRSYGTEQYTATKNAAYATVMQIYVDFWASATGTNPNNDS